MLSPSIWYYRIVGNAIYKKNRLLTKKHDNKIQNEIKTTKTRPGGIESVRPRYCQIVPARKPENCRDTIILPLP